MDIKLRAKLNQITAFVFDVDGVFTDNSIIVGNDDVTRTFNVKDGYAITIALKSNFKIAIISGGRQKSIEKRMNALGIEEVYLSVHTDKKPEVLNQYLTKHNLKSENVLYMGDDIPDYLLMKDFNVLSCCPQDAVAEVQDICDYVSPIAGGRGAVRDVIELVMKCQNKWLKFF